MNTNIPRAIGMLEGLLLAIEITDGEVDINGVKKALKEVIEFLYDEAPHLRDDKKNSSE